MWRTRFPWFPAMIVTSTLLAAAAASAEPVAVPAARTLGAGLPGNVQSALGLTEEQLKQVRQIHAQQAPTRKQIAEQLQQAEADLRQLAVNGGDPSALQAKQAEVTQLLGRTVAMRVESLQALAAVLTPEQRAKLSQMNTDAAAGQGGGHKRQPQGS
jgi:Spy/CpxP family protein refolding chaperone